MLATALHVSNKVQYLIEYYFSDPLKSPVFPGVVCLAVDDKFDAASPVAWGLLRAISPDEPRHVLLLAIARDIKRGAPA